jgi:hypothetical protein
MGQLRIILSLIIFAACGQESKNASNNEAMQTKESSGTITSLVKLIATPDKLDGRQIMVTGFMNIEFEGNAIYLHKDDFDNGLYSNGLWIDLTKEQKKEIDSLNLNRNYVLLEGTFNAKGFGHMGLWSGEIKDIVRITNWGGSKPPIKTIIKFLPPKAN